MELQGRFSCVQRTQNNVDEYVHFYHFYQQDFTLGLFLVFFPSAGECYLMEWSDWSSCVNMCVKEAGVDFGSVQVRSRAVLAQEPENLLLCPDQVWESQSCTGELLPPLPWLPR